MSFNLFSKVCKDRSPNICQNDAVRRDCDLQGNSQLTRMLCPETCGACGDFGMKLFTFSFNIDV